MTTRTAKYTVQAGDSLNDIAASFSHNLTLEELEKANPQIPDPNIIHSGDIINIPGLGGSGAKFIPSEKQFNNMFPYRDPFYTYPGLLSALSLYSLFTPQEAAAFLGNVGHETSGLKYIREISPTSDYCDMTKPYDCPAGKDQYYGRGPIQLTWNYNYKSAGDALGEKLLEFPDLVATNTEISWKSALWFWYTQPSLSGSAHAAMRDGKGFGATIRVINSTECGKTPPSLQVEDRVKWYKDCCGFLSVDPGSNLYC